MSSIVFYSWQSDLPNATNRGFIQTALDNAVKSIRNDVLFQVEPNIDRDTQGVPGAPEIAGTIFSKIEQSEIFVCDISTIGKAPIYNTDGKARTTSNPNVLIELGYALGKLGWQRIIMIMNLAFGELEVLPFDLRERRVITYLMHEAEPDRATERRKLEKRLESELRTIFTDIGRRTSEDVMQQRRVLLMKLRQKYILSHDGITPGMLAGIDPLPKEWVDNELALLGETWRQDAY